MQRTHARKISTKINGLIELSGSWGFRKDKNDTCYHIKYERVGAMI
jgi:hypothetical protein